MGVFKHPPPAGRGLSSCFCIILDERCLAQGHKTHAAESKILGVWSDLDPIRDLKLQISGTHPNRLVTKFRLPPRQLRPLVILELSTGVASWVAK